LSGRKVQAKDAPDASVAAPIRVAVLTVSDRCAAGAMRDRGGPAVARAAESLLGGTGIAERDVTPEATRDVVDVEIPGLGEEMRRRSVTEHPRAALSRATSGALGRTVVVNLPGSPGGAVECLEAVAEVLPHAIELRREPGRDVHAGRPS